MSLVPIMQMRRSQERSIMMRKTVLGVVSMLALAGYVLASDTVAFDKHGVFRTQGDAQLGIYKAYPSEATLTVGGSVAESLWSGMTDVAIEPAGQFNAGQEIKFGDSIRCSRATIDAAKIKAGEIHCTLWIKNRSRGLLQSIAP
jgi:hypothetical protein